MVTISVNCYAGYALFLMTAMPIGFYLSPVLLLLIVVSVPVILTVTIINLFRLKKWAYYTFFILTLLLHSFLIEEDLYYLKIKAVRALEFKQFIPVISLLIFVIYFLLPSVRKLFK
jgi:hypothetical protein